MLCFERAQQPNVEHATQNCMLELARKQLFLARLKVAACPVNNRCTVRPAPDSNPKVVARVPGDPRWLCSQLILSIKKPERFPVRAFYLQREAFTSC
jgi:hypothetical protein